MQKATSQGIRARDLTLGGKEGCEIIIVVICTYQISQSMLKSALEQSWTVFRARLP